MSFLLQDGRLRTRDLNRFLETNNGSYQGLSNKNTPEAQQMQQRLQRLSSMRDALARRGGNDQQLTPEQERRVREAAGEVSEARLAAQRSQWPADQSGRVQPTAGGREQNGEANDPYRRLGRYREGPAMGDVQNGTQQFREGDRGEGVRDLQRRLLEAGYNLGPKGADGFFGPMTQRAAEEFFARHRDLNGQMNQRAVQRVNGTVEGIRSTRGTGIDAR